MKTLSTIGAIFCGLLLVGCLLLGLSALAQTCIVAAPAAPPVPTALVINIPPDGGGSGCTAYAMVSGVSRAPTVFPIGNAKCAVAVAIALQAAAIDNGWNDGGVP